MDHSSVRVVVADRQPLFAECLSNAIGRFPGTVVLDWTTSAEQLLALTRRVRPDVVVADVELLAPMHPEIGCAMIRDASSAKVVMLGDPRGELEAAKDLAAGADALLRRGSSSLQELHHALRAVKRGETYVSPAALVTRRVSRITPLEPIGQPQSLTVRERQVLIQVARGTSLTEIAREWGISAKTVRNHVSHLYEKLGVKSRTGLVLYALSHSLVGPEVMPRHYRLPVLNAS